MRKLTFTKTERKKFLYKKLVFYFVNDMSAFGLKLTELMASRKITGQELSKITGLSDAHISKLKNGIQTWISSKDLQSIADAVTPDLLQRAELIRAHLLDECEGPGSELIEINILGAPYVLGEYSTRTLRDEKLPSDFSAALEVVKTEGIHDKDVRDMIISLAQLVAPHKSPIRERNPTLPGGKYPKSKRPINYQKVQNAAEAILKHAAGKTIPK